jgi:hypothetical protein
MFLKNVKKKILSSRAFLIILCIVIGATYTFNYIEGKKIYEYISGGLEIVESKLNEKQSYKGAVVEAVAYQEGSEGGERLLLSSNPPIEFLIEKYFGEEEKNLAVAIAWCESSLDPSRIGDTHLRRSSYGLFQINQIWHDYSEETLLDAEENIKIAKQIKDKYGWTQWTCYKNNGYKKFLNI